MIEIKKALLPKDKKRLNYLDQLCFPEFQDQVYEESWKKYQNFILLVKNKPVGYVSVQPNTGLYSYKTERHERRIDSLHLTSIGVIPQFRKRRLGELLMAFALSFAKLGHFKSINATTRTSNKPMQFLFKKFGFKVTKKIKSFYPDGETAFVEELFLKTRV